MSTFFGLPRDKQWQRFVDNPYRILALSFALVMLLGSFLLSLPIAVNEGETTSYVDALFTSVSCVSVTGLTTLNTYTHWSIFGQVVMAVLIQIGGLGIMTFTTLLAAMFGRRIGLRDRLTLQQEMGTTGLRGMVKLVVRIVRLTFILEVVGGLIYVYQLYPYLGSSAIYYGLMQGLSAFCNGGFVFFDINLHYALVGDWLFTINTCVLIILGGIGFTVIIDVLNNWKRGFTYFSLHTKVMLVATAYLLLFSFLIILLLEWNNPGTLGPLSLTDKIQASIFQAVTPRSGGVFTLDFGAMYPSTLFFIILLMFIGGGPGSTAGGVKLSTVVLIFVASMTLFRGRTEVQLYERRINYTLVYRALGTVLFSVSIIIVCAFILEAIESISLFSIFFEVTSALGTVGLSTGITSELSTSSKWILIIIMYAGRVGILTLIGSITLKNRKKTLITYPEEHLII